MKNLSLKKILIILSVLIIIGAVSYVVPNKIAPITWGWWGEINQKDSLMLEGYDVVSYFQDAGPVAGDSDINLQRNEVVWYFASEENKILFQTDPEHYTPEFGTFCAEAVSRGFTADIGPEFWHIENGKLYLFLSAEARDTWVSHIPDEVISKSETNWARRINN